MMEELHQYLLSLDNNGNRLEGGKSYKLRLSPRMPSNKFWSVIVYDELSRLMIETDQSWPSVHSQRAGLSINQDGSLDVFFGPKAPENMPQNWQPGEIVELDEAV